MRALIVASSGVAPDLIPEIEAGRRPRLDYFELANLLEAPYIDYDSHTVHHSRLLRFWERLLRLDFFRARQIAAIVREKGYTAVFSWSERMSIPLAYLLDPSVYHVTLLHKPLSPFKLAMLKLLGTFRRWDAMMTFSEAEARVLQDAFHFGADRIHPLSWGVDTDFYQPSEQPSEAAERPHIFSIGVCNRDYATLIEAMRRLPDIECHICATSAWDRRGSSLDPGALPPNVHLEPYDHPTEIRAAYSRCRFVVIPMNRSTSHWSAGCTSVLQPQAMGKPVIATGLPGLAEYLEEGETGLLVDGGDPEALAQAIADLWNDPERVSAMGARARAWVVKHHSLDTAVHAIADVMNEVERPEAAQPSALGAHRSVEG